MKLRILVVLVLAVGLFTASSATAEQVVDYQVAHVRYQNSNMVFVVTNASFFRADEAQQERWYTAVQQCVRGANLAGQTIVVANVRGRFRFYAPRSWHKFLRTLDMNWVSARINKELTCEF